VNVPLPPHFTPFQLLLPGAFDKKGRAILIGRPAKYDPKSCTWLDTLSLYVYTIERAFEERWVFSELFPGFSW
jgi:hypothetical protein